ncbi:unnamed protein product [marine sediment metagenome]|uniref:Uncharacterized protein n=1 Tax=marine sediment metagenome TaxID=412755 RepID=X1J736_9ZZZZ
MKTPSHYLKTKNHPKKEGFSKLLSNIKLYSFINQNGKITNRDVREMFKLSNRAALDEINKLLELQLLKSQNKGRALHYIM